MSRTAVGVVVAGVLALACAATARTPLESRGVDRDRRDCPGHWFRDSTHSSGTVKFAGIRSRVAEFHDCQRFIVGDHQYHGLYALFAAVADVKPAQIQEDSVRAMRASRSGTVAFAAGEVVTPIGGRDYPDLGVRRGYNCLYLTRPTHGAPMGFMLPVGTSDVDCPWVIAAEQPGARRLNVMRLSNADLHETDYPNAARWQLIDGRYVAGVKCGAAWCEVGVASPGDGILALTGTGSRSQRVRQSVPGWSDDQELARLGAGSTEPGVVVTPSRIMAQVIPVPELGDYTIDSFNSGYTLVGVITIRVGLDAPVPDAYLHHKLMVAAGINTVQLHHDPAKPRDLGWTAIITRGTGAGAPADTFEVIRTDHTGLGVPGTMRWRWLANDETVWARCDEGCCQVLQKG